MTNDVVSMTSMTYFFHHVLYAASTIVGVQVHASSVNKMKS